MVETFRKSSEKGQQNALNNYKRNIWNIILLRWLIFFWYHLRKGQFLWLHWLFLIFDFL